MDTNRSELDADVYLLGSGVRSFFQLTLETQYVLKNCNELYFLHNLPSLERFLEKLHKNPVNLLDRFYKDGRDRLDIYSECADFIVERGKDISRVAFLMHGHPLFYSSLAQIIIKRSEEKSLKVRVLSGVSSFDSILTDLRVDVGNAGTQMIGAYSMISGNIKINPKMDLMILQIADYFSSKAHRTGVHSSNDLTDLKEYLLKFYPQDHEIRIIESAVDIDGEAVIHTLDLCDLDTKDIQLNYNHSMFVSALSS